MSNKLSAGWMAHEVDVDKYVAAIFLDTVETFPGWIPKADEEKIRSTVGKYLDVSPVNVLKAITAVIEWEENNDYEALFARCEELNISATDAHYFATVDKAIQLGDLKGLQLLLGGGHTTLPLEKAVLSESGRNARRERTKKRWPESKLAALKKEYLEMRPAFSSDRQLFEELATLILKDKKKYRQIKNRIKEMNLL